MWARPRFFRTNGKKISYKLHILIICVIIFKKIGTDRVEVTYVRQFSGQGLPAIGDALETVPLLCVILQKYIFFSSISMEAPVIKNMIENYFNNRLAQYYRARLNRFSTHPSGKLCRTPNLLDNSSFETLEKYLSISYVWY